MGTIKPYFLHLVYCEACNDMHKQKRKEKEDKEEKILKEVKIEQEKSQILEIVNNVAVVTLGLQLGQFKFVSLRVPFL